MSDMDEIFQVHKNLYIGAYWPQINFEKLKETGITAIVNLMEMNHYTPPEDFIYIYKGLPDNTYPPHHYLKEILNFIDENIKKGKVLVHCAMGISRSGGLIVAWLLKEHPQWSWTDAINYVWKVRRILPAIEIRESILDYLESIEGYRRLL